MSNKGGVGLFQISQKRDFFFFYGYQALLGLISQCTLTPNPTPFLGAQKRPFSRLQFD